MEFCTILKRLRKEKNITQEQLADTINVSRSTIGMYESNSRQPDLKTLEKIADYFNVSSDFLIGSPNNTVYLNHIANMAITHNPVSYLKFRYNIPSYIFATITGLDRNRVDELLSGKTKPTEEEYEHLSNFFELTVEQLKAGELPLYVNEEVKMKILIKTNLRDSAPYKKLEIVGNSVYISNPDLGEEDYKFSPDEMPEISRMINKILSQATTPINHGEAKPSKNPLTYGAIAAEGGKENRPPKKKPKTT